MKRKKFLNFEFLVKKHWLWIFFFLILFVHVFFRFYQLNSVPPSPSLDEVSLGYNAFSLLTVNRDEYGTRLPILLRAYDDWRPALYVYLVMPFVKVFGLSALAVRLPSALLSLISILMTYCLVETLLGKKNLALIASFLLAISPWHLYLSRLGHEVNACLAFTLLAIYFLVKAVKEKGLSLLVVSAIFWALSFYTYQSQKIFGPLMLLSLGLIYRKPLWSMKKAVIVAGLIGFLLLFPLIRVSLTPEGMMRFQGTSIFGQPSELYQLAAKRMTRDYQQGDILGFFIDNRQLAMGLVVLRAYLSHFNPIWLFFNDGAEKHKIPSLGLFYLWELPLLLVGAYQLAAGRFSRQSKYLLFSWLLIAPLAASLTTDAPHAMRIFNVLPVPQLLAALGVMALFKKTKFKSWRTALVIIFLIFSLGFLWHHYFVNFPYEQSASFQSPLAEAIKFVLPIQGQYRQIVFTNQNHGYQSYMFYLFFSQYEPLIYLFQGGTISGGYNEMHQFGRYQFRPIDWEKETRGGEILYIGNVQDFPEEVMPLKEFNLLNGEKAMVAVE
ncbi:MAG: glycosyltransferase family 39 protein [Candidatus Marinimicrobia bacterium]|nr:glycosyltransferase family 39 protein [Candidatus Neomarinimicrobiota bacterium]